MNFNEWRFFFVGVIATVVVTVIVVLISNLSAANNCVVANKSDCEYISGYFAPVKGESK